MQIITLAGGRAIAKPSAITVKKLKAQAKTKTILLLVPTALVISKVAVAAREASTAVITAFISNITARRKSARQMHIMIVEAVLSPLNNFFLVVVLLIIIHLC